MQWSFKMSENLQSESVNELFSALSKAQGEIKGAIKDGINPHFKSTFSSLSSCWDACREPLSKNGLSIIQTPCIINGVNVLVTTLGHTSGQWIKSICPLLTMKGDAQAYGAACTYFRRFSLCSMVGICPEDDDGNLASKPAVQSVQRISRESADELHAMFDKCPENFRKYVLNKISSEMKIGTFYELPTSCYDALRLSIEQNMTKQIEAAK